LTNFVEAIEFPCIFLRVRTKYRMLHLYFCKPVSKHE